MIDFFKRYQVGLKLKDLYPDKKDGLCSCGCGKALTGRQKRWASIDCQEKALTNLLVVKGDIFTIRGLIYQEDQGHCRNCGIFTNDWEADHILPVHLGGGACGLDNFQTLCKDCHKAKSYIEGHLKTISSQADSILSIRRLTEELAVS